MCAHEGVSECVCVCLCVWQEAERTNLNSVQSKVKVAGIFFLGLSFLTLYLKTRVHTCVWYRSPVDAPHYSPENMSPVHAAAWDVSFLCGASLCPGCSSSVPAFGKHLDEQHWMA